MAAFCLLGLLLTLGAVALVSLRPWATDSVAPGLSLSPRFEVAVGEAIALAPERSVGVAAGRVAPTGAPLAVAAATAAAGPDAAQPVLAVSPARALGGSPAVPISSPPAEAPAGPVPPPAPVAVTPAPVPAPAPVPPVLAGGDGHSPGTAAPGGFEPEPECEGDEYTVTVSYEAGLPLDDELPVEILVQRLEDDGSVSELRLEGELGDAHALIELLSAEEGNCVEVVFEQVEPDPALEYASD